MDPESLVAYMRNVAQPAARVFLEAAELDEFIAKADDTVIVAVIADKQDKSYTKYWQRFSQKLRDDYEFAEVSLIPPLLAPLPLQTGSRYRCIMSPKQLQDSSRAQVRAGHRGQTANSL